MVMSMVAMTAANALAQPAQAQATNDQTEEDAKTIQWTAPTLDGKQASVPAADRPTLLVFAKAGQDRSEAALTQVMELAGDNPSAQLLAVVSGDATEIKARTILDATKWPWPIVLDPTYAAAHSAEVRAWPTTVVVRPDGHVAARVAGMSGAYATDIKAYLEFAEGRLEQPELDKRIGEHTVVADSAAQAAERHLRVAQRLIDRREYDSARKQVVEGLAYEPNDVNLQLLHARVLSLLGQPAQSLAILDKIDPQRIAAWQLAVVRGRALMALGKWDDARDVLMQSLKLNPEPAEAHYLLGQIYARSGDWSRAAANYRAAFEATHEGKTFRPGG